MSMNERWSKRLTAGAAGDQSLVIWEITSVTTSFLIAGWLILPFVGNEKLVGAIPVGLAFALMFYSHSVRGESARDVGWRMDNFRAALRQLALPLLGFVLLVLLVGWWTGSVRLELTELRLRFLTLPLWGLLQQYVMQGFINRRAQLLWGKGIRTTLLVGAIFALLHLPNLWLSVATFAGGAILAHIYQRVQNLPALALAHALASLLLISTLQPSTLHNMRVGFKYFE